MKLLGYSTGLIEWEWDGCFAIRMDQLGGRRGWDTGRKGWDKEGARDI